MRARDQGGRPCFFKSTRGRRPLPLSPASHPPLAPARTAGHRRRRCGGRGRCPWWGVCCRRGGRGVGGAGPRAPLNWESVQRRERKGRRRVAGALPTSPPTSLAHPLCVGNSPGVAPRFEQHTNRTTPIECPPNLCGRASTTKAGCRARANIRHTPNSRPRGRRRAPPSLPGAAGVALASPTQKPAQTRPFPKTRLGRTPVLSLKRTGGTPSPWPRPPPPRSPAAPPPTPGGPWRWWSPH